MKRVQSRFIMLATALSAAACAAFAFEISLTPENPAGGEGFLLQVSSAAAGLYEAEFSGKSYSFMHTGPGNGELFLPLKIEDSGRKKISVARFAEGSVPEYREAWLTVKKRAKKSVRLRPSDEKMRADEPILEDQNKLILTKLRQRTDEKLWAGAFAPPIKARIATRFALQRKASTYQYYHKGIDYSAPEGKKIKAAGDGTITLALGGFNVYGNAVIIDHGQGVASCYFHLSRILKKEGDRVSKGEDIAEVGSTGWATGPHLHFGVYLQGEAVDPLWWIKFTDRLDRASKTEAK